MSKKETEFDRFDRMKKLEQKARKKSAEADVEEELAEEKKRSGRNRLWVEASRKHWIGYYQSVPDEEREYEFV